jgi:hypothetical protein
MQQIQVKTQRVLVLVEKRVLVVRVLVVRVLVVAQNVGGKEVGEVRA